MYYNRLYLRNAIVCGLGMGVRVIELRQVCVFGKNRVHESVRVLGDAIRADFVPQCNMIACRAGRLNFKFLPTFLHILSAFKLKETVRHMSSSFSCKHIISIVKNWLT